MSASFSQQFRAVLRKNLIYHLRSRAFLRQLINIGIMVAIIIILDKLGGQASSQQPIPFFMGIAITLFCRGVAMSWVNQRQSRQAEVQKIMGLSNAAYYSGWIVFYLIDGLIISVIFMGILSAANVFTSFLPFGTALGLYFLYMVASFSFVLFLTCFFSDALLASQIITFIQLIGSILYYLLNIQSFRNSLVALQATALLPSVCFQYTIMSYGKLFTTPFTINQGYITLGCQAVIYFLLFAYLSLVLPNENGNNLHPLFFLKCLFQSKNKRQIQENLELVNLSSARYYQQTKEHKKVSMYLKQLTKRFDSKLIVNNLSLSLFQGEVFCLLGHNGAGKSTTINMLTGILSPDSGSINICGYDYYTEMTSIRSKTGVCLQIDVLYDELTVINHLEYYANIKGIANEDIQRKVEEIVLKCGLIDQVNKKVKELSGGNKRKACLACASIGNSQLLFLDQPSSGLDPTSRKTIWSMIEQLRKEGRTIILTTHHLQEAEVLANRIGILAHGELLVQGSCLYIKQRFGCGYYLQIALPGNKSLEQQKRAIRKKVKDLIANCRQDEQVSQSSMKFLLPMKEQEHYFQLFAFLQAQGYRISLKLSSLEDIFIKIGIDASSILSNQPLPQIQKIKIPHYQPKFSFFAQYSQTFIKKYKTTIRTFAVFISVFLPILFIVLGVVISMLSFQYTSNIEQNVINTWSRYYNIAFFMCLAFAFNTASYCGSIVKQREIKFRYLSNVMGIKKSAYWLGTVSFDLLMFCVPFAIIFLTIGCFPSSQSSQFVSSFGWLALSLILFSFAFLSFTYLWSFAFESAKKAYRFYPFMVFVIFYVIPIIPIYLIPDNTAIHYVLPLISPLLGLTSCMMSQSMLGASNYEILTFIAQENNVQLFVQAQIWYPLVIFIVQTFIYFGLVLLLDNWKFNLKDRQEITSSEQMFNKSQDLKKQKSKINNVTETKPIVVDSLFKKYPNGHVAIRDNSFLIEKGETFGLLGPNGAGKSTTFNILTAAIPKTRGKVMLHGAQVNRSVDQIFTTVGVCPQFNPLYDQLTTAEHIQFFAGLKGLQGKQKTQITNFYIKNLQLQEYRDMRSNKLSGGNKRKLCVAMSLIGNPSLIFLDEPSAGVDPIARRFLWNILHSSSSEKSSSIVLTTHSINQAESLCDRIGILIKGEFFCIDTPAELKKRYGRGYRAIMKCQQAGKMAQIRREVQQCFSQYKQEILPEDSKLSFEFNKKDFVFSKAFNLFYNKLSKQQLISQFEISETTLEQVFIHLSKMQLQGDEAVVVEETSNCCCCQRNSSGCFCIC